MGLLLNPTCEIRLLQSTDQRQYYYQLV